MDAKYFEPKKEAIDSAKMAIENMKRKMVATIIITIAWAIVFFAFVTYIAVRFDCPYLMLPVLIIAGTAASIVRDYSRRMEAIVIVEKNLARLEDEYGE